MKLRVIVAVLCGMFVTWGVAEARTQIVSDTTGEHGAQGKKIDLKSVRVSQSGDRINFILKFRHAGKRRSGVTINSERRRYIVSRGSVMRYNWSDGSVDATGKVRFRGKQRVHVFSFPLSAIGSPKRFEWMSWGMMSHYTDDRVPNRGFKSFKVGTSGPSPLSRVTIKFAGGKGRFTVKGKPSEASAGKLTITKGKINLVKPQRYRAQPGAKDVLILRLTKAGKKALAKKGRVKGLMTLTANDGDKAKFTAILKQR